MPLYQMMLDIAQQKQQIQSGEMLNALRGVEIAQTIKQNRIEDDTRARIQQAELLRLSQRDKDEGKTQSDNVPEDLRTPLTAQRKAQQDAEFFDKQASQARLAGNLDAANKLDRVSKDYAEIERKYDAEVRKWKSDQTARVASAAGTYDESPNYAIAQMSELDPQWFRRPGVKVDLNSLGEVVPGPATRASLLSINKGALSANQQLQREDSAKRIKDAEDRALETKRKDEAAEQDRRDNRIKQRENVDSLIEARKAKADVVAKREERIARTEKAAKDPSTKDYKIIAAKLQKDLKLPPEDASMMGRDVLLETARLQREDSTLTPTEAQEQAIEKLTPLIHRDPDTPTWGGFGTPAAGKTHYRSLDPVNKPKELRSGEVGGQIRGVDTPTASMVNTFAVASPKLSKAGITFNLTQGKLVLDSKLAKGEYKQLAIDAQAAIDKGADPEAVLKRLAEKVQ